MNARTAKHSENADWVIAELMNCLNDGSIDVTSESHRMFNQIVDVYLREKGYEAAEIPLVWNGEIQLTSS